jgi:tRNA nucleotidyltransferase (CCA-adding enzyme)
MTIANIGNTLAESTSHYSALDASSYRTLYLTGLESLNIGCQLSAIEHFKASLTMASQHKDEHFIAYNNIELGKIELEKRSFENAYKYLDAAWKKARTLKLEEVKQLARLMQDVYRWRFEDAEAKGTFNHVSSGGVVFHIQNNRPDVLLLHRIDNDTWHLPKGTIENNESLEEAAIREVYEETNIQGAIQTHLIDVFSDYWKEDMLIPKKTTYFLMKALTEQAQPDHEHDEAKFINIAEATLLIANTFVYEYELPVLELAGEVLKEV